jgi:hypothetical protein
VRARHARPGENRNSRSRSSQHERLAVLREHGITFDPGLERERLGRSRMGIDDLIDAAVALVTAARLAAGIVEVRYHPKGLNHHAMRAILAVLVAAVIATASPVSYAQTSAGSNRVVSPTTVVYWQQHDNGDGTGSLDLLVLWRGSPGWFLRGRSASSGGGDGRGGFGQWQSTHWMTYGEVTLTFDFTPPPSSGPRSCSSSCDAT